MRQWQRLSSATRKLAETRPGLFWGLLLFALSLAQYAYSLGNPLIWDSRSILLEDPSIRDLANIPGFFLQSTLPLTEFDADKVFRIHEYRPLLKVLYALEYAAFKATPLPYHLINLLVNAGVVVALFFVILALGGELRLAAAAAALYAVNPTRGEAVNWVYGISTLVMALCVLLAFHLYHRRRHGWAAAAFALALLSRESAVLFPVVLLAYEYLLRRDEPARRYLKVVPYAVLVLLYLLLRTAAVGELPPVSETPPLVLLGTAAVILQRSLKIFLIPDAPVTYYPFERFEASDPEVLVSLAVAAAAAVAMAWLWRRDRFLAFWYLWFFVWISIYFNVGRFIDFLMCEKCMYFASAGLCVVAADLLLRLRFAPLLLAAVVALHFSVTFARSTYWRDPVVHFEQAVAFSPDFVSLRYQLALAQVEKEDYAAAAAQFEQVVEAVPGHSMALNNLGNCYYALGDLSRAGAFWTRAYAADPGNGAAAYNVGYLAESTGDLATALDYYRRYMGAAREVPPEIARHVRELERLLGVPEDGQ